MSVLRPKTTRTQRDKNAVNCTLPARSDLEQFIHFLSLSGLICKKWKKKLRGEDQSGDAREGDGCYSHSPALLVLGAKKAGIMRGLSKK